MQQVVTIITSTAAVAAFVAYAVCFALVAHGLYSIRRSGWREAYDYMRDPENPKYKHVGEYLRANQWTELRDEPKETP